MAPGTHCTGDWVSWSGQVRKVCSWAPGDEVPGREADQHHGPEERSSQPHRSDTLKNSRLAMLVCTHVHSADETGSVTRG